MQSIIRGTDRLENPLHKQNRSTLSTCRCRQRGSWSEEEEKESLEKQEGEAEKRTLCGSETRFCSGLCFDNVPRSFRMANCLCALCV